MDSRKRPDWKIRLEAKKKKKREGEDLYDKAGNLGLFLISKGKPPEGFQSHLKIYHWKANHQTVL